MNITQIPYYYCKECETAFDLDAPLLIVGQMTGIVYCPVCERLPKLEQVTAEIVVG